MIQNEADYWNEKYNSDERMSRIMYEDIACAYTRPSKVFSPKIYPDGDMWCCLLGDNIQEGVVGFGKTPELACKNFDHNFMFGES